jgi:hypothetical protein
VSQLLLREITNMPLTAARRFHGKLQTEPPA